MGKDYKKIIPTALLCAKTRALYTDLAFSKEIYNELRKMGIDGWGTNSGLFMKCAFLFPSFRSKASILEGRYLSINDAIDRFGECSILELASGLSPRGKEYSERTGQNYVETDLEEMVLLKREIIKRLGKTSRGFHKIIPANPLNLADLMHCGRTLRDTKPIAVVNEGLLMYLTLDEKRKLRDNIAFFLKEYSRNGVWITSDFSSRPVFHKGIIGLLMRRIESLTSRSFFRFGSDEEAYEFLKEGGLDGEPVDNRAVFEKLSSLGKLGIEREEAIKLKDLYRAWQITLNHGKT